MPAPKGSQNALKPKRERRTARLVVKVTADERENLHTRAKLVGLDLSKYVRERLGL